MDREFKKQQRLESRVYGRKVQEIIEKRGIKYNFIAQAIHIDRSALSQFLNGHRIIPQHIRQKLEEYLGVNIIVEPSELDAKPEDEP